jgi:peptide/nickel transport system substrate-binding protein
MTAWQITGYEPGTTLMIATRNPYYWKVDPEGNQLPYIDEVYFHLVEDTTGVNLMGIAGNLSMQRVPSTGPVPGLHGKRRRGNYHMMLWPQAMASAATYGQHELYEDNIAPLPDLRFRLATSIAVDRTRSTTSPSGQACRARDRRPNRLILTELEN